MDYCFRIKFGGLEQLDKIKLGSPFARIPKNAGSLHNISVKDIKQEAGEHS